MKRFMSMMLTLVLLGSTVLSMFAFTEEASASAGKRLAGRDFGSTINLGPQALGTGTVSVNDSVYGTEDGRPVFYTTASTENAIFNVIDIKSNTLLRSFSMTGVNQVWRHAVAPDGTVYIGAISTKNGVGVGELWKYSPVTKTVENLGEPLPGEKSIWSMTVAPDGMVYGGTFQKGKVFQYNPTTGAYRDYGSMIEGQQYVRSMAYHEGYLYAGIGSQGDIIKLNVVTGEKESIFDDVPGMLGVTPEQVPFVYSLAIVDGYLLARLEGGIYMELLFYDLAAGEWKTNRIGKSTEGGLKGTGVYGYNQLESRNGKIYLGANGFITEIDLATQTSRSTGLAFGSSMRGAAWITFDDQDKFPGESLVTMTSGGKIIILNFTTNTRTDWDNVSAGGPIPRHNLEKGPDGKLYMSGYPGGLVSVFDPVEEKTVNFSLGQAEGMVAYGDDMYFGIYPHAELYKVDTTAMSLSGQKLAEIGYDQDRPYIMKNFGDKLYIGTIAGYGKATGALSVYDPATESLEVFENVVANQGIVGLAEKDGILFGSTTITPGLGIDVIEPKAKMFVWDIANKQKITEFTLDIPDLDKPKLISGLTFDAEGMLWGTVDGIVFKMNPDDYSIVDYKNIYPATKNYGMWRPIHTHWGEDGLLYTDLAGKVTVIDPATMDHVTLTPTNSEVKFMTIAKDAAGQENIYYLMDGATDLLMIPVTQVEMMSAVEYKYTANTSFDISPLGNWNHFNGSNEIIFERSEEKTHSGPGSIKIVDTSTTLGRTFTTYPINISPNTTYTISMWHYVDEGQSSDDAIMLVYLYDASNANLPVHRMDVTNRSITKQWVKETITFTTPSNAAKMRLMPNTSAWNTFTAYYDDVTVTIEADKVNLPGELALGAVPSQVVKGNLVTIPVKVKDATDLYKIQAVMSYDKEMFEFVSLEPSSQFVNGKTVNSKVHTDVEGIVDFNISHTAAANSVTSTDVVVANLTLKAKATTGTASVALKEGSEISKSAAFGGVLNEDISASIEITSGLPSVPVTQPVTNYSFEDALMADGVIRSWSKHYNTGLDFTLSTDRSRSGDQSLKIVDESTSTMGGYMSYAHAVSGNQKYEVSMWVNIADGAASDDAIMLIYAYAAGGSSPVATYRIDVKGEDRNKLDVWTKQSTEFVTPPETASMRFLLYSSAFNTFTAYYDDITLTTVHETADVTGSLALESEVTAVTEGTYLDVVVKTDQAVNVNKIKASVSYDASRFEIIGFEPLNGFGNVIAPNASTPGELRFNIEQSGSNVVNGNVEVGKIILKAKDNTGTAAVTLNSGAEISSTAFGSKYAISDEQSVLSFSVESLVIDLPYVKRAAQNMGAAVTNANRHFDVNGDGIIDIADVALLYLEVTE